MAAFESFILATVEHLLPLRREFNLPATRSGVFLMKFEVFGNLSQAFFFFKLFI